LYPTIAIIAFLFVSYASSGVLLVTSGFFVPENPAHGHAIVALDQIVTTTRLMAGSWLLFGGAAGLVAALSRWRDQPPRSLLVVSLAMSAVLPFGAFYAGHPLRVRYMVPLVAAAAAMSGFGLILLPRRARTLAAIALVAMTLWVRPPLLPTAPMIVEAQWETPLRLGRREVSAFLKTTYDGTPILASMSSLAHYMQESSAIGLHLSNFVHEGNGDLWMDAFGAPKHHVGWILIEETAEGGDVLAQRAHAVPGFLDGFTRVFEKSGLAVYRRTH
jgi:hypothetical protein